MNADKHGTQVGEIIFAIATTVDNSILQPKIFNKNGVFTEKLFQTGKKPKTLQS